jgi:hypothetical protein
MEAVKNWRACIHEPGSGPLTGHYARRVPVTQGHLRHQVATLTRLTLRRAAIHEREDDHDTPGR